MIDNAWAIVFRTLKFQGFNVVITQYSQIIPLVLQAPRFFAGQISLGDIQQTASRVQPGAGRAVVLPPRLRRLRVLPRHPDPARRPPRRRRRGARAPVGGAGGGATGSSVAGLTVRLPDERPLIDDLDRRPHGGRRAPRDRAVRQREDHAAAQPRRPLAVRRRHGAPTARREAFFLAQQPYVPLGTLRAGLTYPAAADTLADDRAAAVLRQVQLPHLADRLDDETDWAPPALARRAAAARLRPRAARPAEGGVPRRGDVRRRRGHGSGPLRRCCARELPDAILVSVGHRSTLSRFHARQLELVGEGGWEISTPRR